jgi:catechol 2,3-dioxygenase-like lactoylglutathione lyase family enzyme
MTNKKNPKSSALTVAHIVVMVSDLEASCRFYTELGLAPFTIDGDSVAVIEFHGGIHILLFKSNGEKMTIFWLAQLDSFAADFQNSSIL